MSGPPVCIHLTNVLSHHLVASSKGVLQRRTRPLQICLVPETTSGRSRRRRTTATMVIYPTFPATPAIQVTRIKAPS